MKPLDYWVRVFLVAAGLATALLIGVDLIKGYSLERTLGPSFAWGAISALIYTVARWRQARQQAACALCRD